MNRIPTRSGCFTPPNLRLNGLILALALGLTTLPSMANMSNPTNGRIYGRAPDVTGKPIILMPDGTTPVTNNVQVLWTAKTADFKLAPLSSYVTYVDADGDAPQGVGYTTPPSGGVSWVWTTSGGTSLSTSQLTQPFQNSFADGTKLKVTASQAVDVTSVSGMPNVRQRTLQSGTFDVVVKKPLTPPKVLVGGKTFDGDAGFPTTGFPGAYFQFYMNGASATANRNYTYSSDQNWVSVINSTTNTAGRVTLTSMPTSANNTATIKIEDKSGGAAPVYYTFTVKHWFLYTGKSNDARQYNLSGAKYKCDRATSITGEFAVPVVARVSTGSVLHTSSQRLPASGQLWPEWGPTMTAVFGTSSNVGYDWVWVDDLGLAGPLGWVLTLTGGTIYSGGHTGSPLHDGMFSVLCWKPI